MDRQPKVMLIDFDDAFFMGVAKELVRRRTQIPYVITSNPSEYKKSGLFKHSKLFHPFEFSYPKLINKLNIKNSESLSKEILKDFVECENLFLTITDRLNFFPLPVQKRKQIYQQLLLYWYSFFKHNPIDSIVLTSTPHMGYPNIIYAVAKKLQINTFYVQRTLLENQILVLNDYETIHKVPPDFMKNEKKGSVIEAVGKDLYRRLFTPSVWIKRSDQVNQKAINRNWIVSLREFIAVVFRFFVFLFKGQSTSVFYLNNGLNKIYIGFICLFMNLRMQKLKTYYLKKTVRVNLKKKFIYFPLHFQPEKSTLPEGGVFENQILAIDILSKSIPKNWYIYVKEHPRQFEKNDPRRLHFRDEEYYDRISAYKNVKIINVEENSQSLIKKAVFTVTVTGSSGWQSLLEHKPCLVFGNPWYSGCNSCFTVGSSDECKDAIQHILKKNRVSVELDVLKFLAYNKKTFVVSTNDFMFVSQSKIPMQTLVSNLTDRLIKLIE